MNDFIERTCPECGQELRFPKNIGGMLMACPSCGKKFRSDFKLGGKHSATITPVTKSKGIIKTIFELPYEIFSRICRYLAK